MITASTATHAYLRQQNLRPQLLIHPALAAEYADLDCHSPNAVVVGDAGPAFTYDNLNAAFRILSEQPDAPLIAMGSNRYFMEAGGLSLDMGPFVAALEYATGRKAMVTGKPASTFFQTAVDRLQASPQTTVMIGDDLENDIGGAQACGINGILVRTGKFQATDAHDPVTQPMLIMNDFAAVIDGLLGN
jgi:HAD superfamily hydrolase (TIGR01458 family)